MTEDSSLNFRFKGSRGYVQGGDIFDAVEALVGQQEKHVLELSFREFSHMHMKCVFYNPEEKAKAEGVTIDKEGRKERFWLIETKDAVTERYAFDEEAIVSCAHIDGKTLVAKATPGYSVIEQIIAHTKALNYQITPDIKGKWVFGQLRLSQPLPVSAEQFCICQKTLLAGRFSVQEITLDDQAVGQIRFITSES